jgi:ferredoxin
MRVEFDRDICIGMFQCVAEWEKFQKDEDAGKATLVNSRETTENVFVCEIPEDEAFEAEMAGRVCPVDAITVYDDEDNQIVP